GQVRADDADRLPPQRLCRHVRAVARADHTGLVDDDGLLLAEPQERTADRLHVPFVVNSDVGGIGHDRGQGKDLDLHAEVLPNRSACTSKESGRLACSPRAHALAGSGCSEASGTRRIERVASKVMAPAPECVERPRGLWTWTWLAANRD